MEGKGKFGCLYLIIALAASLLLSAAIAYLEIKRDKEINDLSATVQALLLDVKILRDELVKVKNESNFIVAHFDKIAEDQNYSARSDIDEYADYADDYDNEEQDEERKKRSIRSSKRSLLPYSLINKLQPEENETESENIIKQTYSNSSPAPVVATIYLESSPYVKQSVRPVETRFPPKKEECDYSKCMKNVAAHFDGNSSAARNGHHPHYDSNHRMYHPRGIIKEWTKASWVPDPYEDSTLYYDNGEVKITDSPGLYYVYAQVFYADPHDSAGFRIYVNDEIVMQCTVTSHGPHQSGESKRNSCHTGGLVKLNIDDKISVKEVEGTRYTIFEHTKSFFGLFRVAAM